MIIGITGRGGSGKSTLANNLKSLNPNYIHLEVDKLIEKKVLVSNNLLSNVNGRFNDKKYTINDIVLSYFDKSEKNKIIHRYFLNEVAYQINLFIKDNKNSNIIIDWFLLHEIFDLIPLEYKILTEASVEVRIQRVLKRQKTNDINMFIDIDNSYIEKNSKNVDLIVNTEICNYSEICNQILTYYNDDKKVLGK